MPSEDITELLGGWEGYRVGFVQRHEPDKEGAAPQIWIELIRESDGPMICSGCVKRAFPSAGSMTRSL